MEYKIEGNPDYGQLSVQLGPDERFIAEGGAMAWMSDGMQVKARLIGGLLKAVVRKLVAWESLFTGEYRHPTGGSATFSSARPGTVLQRTLNAMIFLIQGGGKNIFINTGVPQDLSELTTQWLRVFGFEEAQMVRKEEERPQNALKAHGLSPDDI